MKQNIEISTENLMGIPHYQIKNAQLSISLSFHDCLQYIFRLRMCELALLICKQGNLFHPGKKGQAKAEIIIAICQSES